MKHFLITIIAIVTLVGCGGAEERKAAYLEKAKLSMDSGDLDKARIELKNVLQIDPKDAQAFFQLGNIFEQKKEYRKAFGNYLKAVELNPDNLEVQAKIGRFYLVFVGDLEKSIEKRDLILAKDEANAGGLLLKASILIKQKDVVGAKKISHDLFLKHPEHIENAIFLATLHLREKGYADSLDVLNTCIKKHPNNIVLKNILANTYRMAGKHEQAERTYKEILENKPELFSNHMQLAMFYHETDHSEKAEDVIRNAIAEDEKDIKRKLLLVEFIQKIRGSQEAIGELILLIEKNSGMGELRLALGKFYVTENKLEDAEKIFNTAVSDFSEDSVGIKSRVYLAKLYMKKENVDAAINIIDDAVKISPNDTEVNFVKAKLQLVNKDYEGAIISLRTVVKDDVENMDAYFLLSAAHKAIAEEQQASEVINRAYENNRTNTKGLLTLAKYHASNKKGAELEKVVDSYLSIDPDNYEALSYKSALLNQKKMFSEAKPVALHMIELHPDMPNGYIQSMPYMLAEKKRSEAISLLENSYNKVKDNTQILEFLVSLHVASKNFDKAENKVKSAIQENGETAELLVLMAKIQMTSSKKEAAKTTLLKASAIKPDWNEPYSMLANIYMTDKQNQKAIKVLQKGLSELKSDLKLSLVLAKIYESLSDFSSAISEYEKAYEKYSNNVILLNNLAALLSEHRTDEKSLKRAKELADKLKNSDQAVILDTVGWVYYKTGAYVEAVNVLKTVVEKSPNAAVFNYHLGMALYKTGDEAAAKTYLTSALANKGSFPGKDDAEVQLKKLQ